MSKGKFRAKIKLGNERKKTTTSIYLYVWAAFSVMAFVIVLMFGLSQNYLLANTYEQVTVRDLAERGKQIETAIRNTVEHYPNGDYSAFIRYLSTSNDVDIYILDEQGGVLYPLETGGEDLEIRTDFTSEMKELKKQLQAANSRSVVYAGNAEGVYGSLLFSDSSTSVYLYVSKSSVFIDNVIAQVRLRMVLMCVFVFLLSFAVSSGISGLLVGPIRKMTEKARLFAQGDFKVDFPEGVFGSEMVELGQMLNYARDEISKADSMQKELIANVSHDFKTPLTMIKAYASMIREISGNNPEKRNKHALVIEEEADRLTSLVNDVLDLSKVRSGIDTLKISTFDLSAYTYEILDRFNYLTETQGYRFVVNVADGLYTSADELKIGQVLYNLIGNAVNYTGENKTVYIDLRKYTDEIIRFDVRDTGKGIKPEEISTIWERYYRSSEMHKRPVKGTGLGLSIVKSILQKHGFLFGVDSEVGKGSSFYVLFPLVK